MFADYTKLVLRDYEKKRAANVLSIRLIHPSPAKLREESLAVRSRRYDRKKDEVALAGFFGHGDDKEMLHAIKRMDIDKFRPLANFLKRPSINTDKKNVELLAWLIDFEFRPYELGKHYDAEETGTMVAETGATGNKVSEETGAEDKPPATPLQEEPEEAGMEQADPDGPVQPGAAEGLPMGTAGTVAPGSRPRFKMRIAVIVVIAAALTGIAIYWFGKNKATPISMGRSLRGNGACMYWTGDHYQQISCTEKLGDTLILALDPEKLRSFKKITRPDTITGQSKGGVWYVKINGQIEFYTSDGYHPTDRQLRLKPVTDYIIKKYIHPDQE
ncbi:hypothetical protein [Niabella beijingensis]|uniref:hypothetical protein n=1 Tax=Niabella beijingensis TaxID=2872700 RepID=UPI001CBF3983|nr:hypothetical protein [Niabella beijingensis]MBZ4188856.1 hypothetical protein [Niabella beijingensis]